MAVDDRALTWKWGAVGAAVLGVIQISAGVILQVRFTGSISAVGILLTRLGSYDIVSAVRTGLAKTFSWSEYLIEKLVSTPFTVVSIGVEHWLYGGAEHTWRRSIWRMVARKVGMGLTRGVATVCFGKALKIAKDVILEKHLERLEAAIEGLFERIFVDLQKHVEMLFRLNPADAERLIWEAFADVLSRADEDDKILDRIRSAAVEFLSTLLVELGLEFLSRSEGQDFSDRTLDSIKFTTLTAISVAECSVFVRNLLTSLDEALKTICQQNQAADRHICQLLAPPADKEDVEEFVARFKRRVKASVARKVSERVRRGLLQATAQSFILGILM